jgi:hypothetical protein
LALKGSTSPVTIIHSDRDRNDAYRFPTDFGSETIEISGISRFFAIIVNQSES